jgi:indole-3-glycerol phosphate synthase
MSDNLFLQRILAHKHEEVARQRVKAPLSKLQQQAAEAPPTRPFAAALRHEDRLGLIAEIKKQSPSRGVLTGHFDPLQLARVYTDNGADAISVLTDVRFFGGSLQHLKAVRADQESNGRQTPLLRKDFLVDAYQVYEARAYGADAVLVIVAAVERETVEELIHAAREAGMEALVEVHTEAELAVALAAGAELIGINNRDLRTFEVDVETTDRLLAGLPPGPRPVMVSLSGLSGAGTLAHLRAIGADAILVGEAIMTASDPAAKVRELSGRPEFRA